MDKSLKLTRNQNIKNGPTDSTISNRLEIPTEMQLNSIKQESDCLIQSEIYVKMEPQEDENEFSSAPSTFYQLCPNYDMKIKMEESIIKTECGELLDKVMQDPLDVGSKIKIEKQFRINLEHVELGIKTELTRRENEENLFEFDENFDSHGSCSNQGQEQVLIKNYSGHKVIKYICDVCNKAFKLKSDLNRHLRIHTGEKPFMCEICKKSFIQKQQLDSHMLIHSGEKPHVCEICKKVFSRKSSLNTHNLIHIGVKPFLCKGCNKSFTNKSNLIAHERVHTGDKPFVCDICKKSFTQKSDLTRHIRTHTGEKPYSCDVCDKSFARRGYLNLHKKIHIN